MNSSMFRGVQISTNILRYSVLNKYSVVERIPIVWNNDMT